MSQTSSVREAPTKDARSAASWLRATYWWSTSATAASFTPYITLYYRFLGFSGIQIGILASIIPLGAALLTPIWGALADSYSAHRLVLRAVLVLAAGMALALTGVGSFAGILVLIALLAILIAPINSLLDSYALTIGPKAGISYGALRVWGSVGYIIVTWLVGLRMNGGVSRFFLFAYAACLVLACIATLGLPKMGERVHRSVWSGVGSVMYKNWPLIWLLVTAYLFSSSAGIMYSYISIYLNERGGTPGLLGVAFALNAISELPILALGGWIYSKLGGRNMITMATALYTLRFVGYSLIPTATWVLPFQLLHGLTYAAFQIATVTLAYKLGGRGGQAATSQGLLASVSTGFGTITGSLLGGVVIDRAGTGVIFWVAAAIMAFALVFHLATSHYSDMSLEKV